MSPPSNKNKQNRSQKVKGSAAPNKLSKATLAAARKNIKKLETQSENNFLIRADMDRKLDSL